MRASEDEVLAILGLLGTVTPDKVTAFLIGANTVVTDRLGDLNYSDDLMREIERWLAAAYYTNFDAVVKEEKLLDQTTTYQMPSGEGMLNNPYFATACQMDRSGRLSAKKMARFHAGHFKTSDWNNWIFVP